MKDYAGGAEIYLMAAQLRKRSEGVTEEYATLMYSAAICSNIGKNYTQALDAYNAVLGFYEGKDSDAAKNNVAQCRRNMGNVYIALKDYDSALECFEANLARQAEIGNPSADYAKALERVAAAEKFLTRYDSAIDHYKQSIEMYRQSGNEEEASKVTSSLNFCYAIAGRSESIVEDDAALSERNRKLNDIIREETESLELTKTYLGELRYANSLATIAGCCHLLEDYSNSVDYYERYMQSVRGAISEEFSTSGAQERALIWEEQKPHLAEILELMITLPVGYEDLMPRVTALAYDAELLRKGILLKSSIEFENVLKSSDDASLLSDYEEFKMNSERIQQLRASASSEEDLDAIVQLTQRGRQMSLSIMGRCADIADYTQYLSYTWNDVQDRLGEDDVAIEFAAADVDVFDENNFMAAIVLTKDMRMPVAVPVCNLQVAKAMALDSLLYDTPVAGDIVWAGSLDQYIKDKRRIYFTADGAFNRIAIEHLQYGGAPLSSLKEVYRLSSTKELCGKYAPKRAESAVIYGNIDYINADKASSDTRGSSGMLTFANLDNAGAEVQAIQALLRQKGMEAEIIEKDKATEDNFLRLSGSGVTLLHVTTHGYYMEDKSASDAESLDHSCLVFAGVNLLMDNEDKTDDGLVTAGEIAEMDLRDCRLAVLSACETGLGKLGDDGVFGLQRGFKNAGVHTLLMTLKPVYDASTARLMELFYQNLTSGMPALKALSEAQRSLRDAGFAEGRYWAPFILLDATSQVG